MCDKTAAPDHRLPRGYSDREVEDYANQIQSSPGGQLNDAEILTRLFTYQKPNAVTIPKYAAINQAAKNFAEVVLQVCPPSADRTDAIRQIRNAKKTANESIALDGLTLY